MRQPVRKKKPIETNKLKKKNTQEEYPTQRQLVANNIETTQNWTPGNDTRIHAREPTPHSVMYPPRK